MTSHTHTLGTHDASACFRFPRSRKVQINPTMHSVQSHHALVDLPHALLSNFNASGWGAGLRCRLYIIYTLRSGQGVHNQITQV